MEPGKKYFICLCWISFVYILGILLFTKGFLLKRLVIDESSPCDVNFTVKSDNHGQEGCWTHKRFDKAVIIIIDALRYDFAFYNSSLKSDDALAYQNKLPVLNELLHRQPKHARLYHFIADPPTTTMQRLKGLTTGSLPTFVDAGANFASSEITEDNFIDQLLKLGKKISFMGDDTWESLYPNRFKKSFPFPSFNVKDLHTVDNGVIKHLVPELRKRDWDLLIGHFLGVDHCGHRYGPYHPEMSEKLNQMDNVIRSVVRELKEDTVLFIFGDHGMTKTGDHGGDSNDELDAGLFVYSPSQITANNPKKGKDRSVSQIDLVPTLSLLLGTPIPFSSLGMVIPGLFNHCPWWSTEGNSIKQMFHMLKALRLNAHQVREYLEAYAKRSDEFPHLKYAELDVLFRQTETHIQEIVTMIQIEGREDVLPKMKHLRSEYVKYLSDVKSMCQGIWAKFDLNCIILGVLTIASAVLSSVWILGGNDLDDSVIIGMVGSAWCVLYFGFLYSVGLGLRGLIASLSVGIVVIFVSVQIVARIVVTSRKESKLQSDPLLETNVKSDRPDYTNLVAIILMCLYAGSVFSNSFVVYEDDVSGFLSQSMIWFLAIQISLDLSKSQGLQETQSSSSKKSKIFKFDLGRLITSPRFILISLAMVFCLSIRLSCNFRACREEQWPCDISDFLQPLSALTDDQLQYKNVRYFFSVACIIAMSLGTRFWLRYFGNLNGFAPTIICASYLIPVSTVVICFYWALQALPPKVFDKLPIWQIISLPRVIYVVSFTCLVSIIWSPLCVFVVPKSRDSKDVPLYSSTEENLLPRIYNHIRVNWRSHLGSVDEKPEQKPPVVYGLATVYSSLFVVLCMTVVLVLAMLLGDGMAPTLTLLLVAMATLLEISACKAVARQTATSDFTVGWSTIFSWGLLATQFFFATGHHATVTTIRWEAAYVGFHGDFEFYQFFIPATLISLNTFASHVLCTITLPLLLFWPLIRGQILHKYERLKDKDTETRRKGEFILNERPDLMRVALFQLVLGYMLFFGVRVLATAAAAGLHRRHLMVWKIFAPRFVYEGATYLLVTALLLLMYLLVLRVDKVLTQWFSTLQS